jgi:hypothetical protein
LSAMAPAGEFRYPVDSVERLAHPNRPQAALTPKRGSVLMDEGCARRSPLYQLEMREAA